MAKPDSVFVYVGTYPQRSGGAEPTTTSSRTSTPQKAVGTYDASVVTKDPDGKVHVNKDETSTRHGAWGGAAVGALVGIIFPPSLVVGAAVGRRGRQCGRPPVERHVPGGRQRVRGHHRRRTGCPGHRGRKHHRSRPRQGRTQGREACGQGARRGPQGHRPGGSRNGERAQLTRRWASVPFRNTWNNQLANRGLHDFYRNASR